MQYRFLGATGLKVSALSLGGWITYGGQVTGDGAAECMAKAWEYGINYFDTAEVYANGECEKAMGAAIQKLGWNRSDYVISTKLYWGGAGPNDKGLSRKHLLEGMKKSLERLQLDYVDIVMAHRPDPLTPMEEIVRAFTKIVNDGHALYWGTSEWSAFEIEHAHHVATKYNLIAPSVDQPQYNLLERNKLEKEFVPLFKLYEYGTTIWSPLSSGILTGKYNDGIPEDGRLARDDPIMKKFRDGLSTEEGKAKLEKVRKLTKVAEKLGATTAQLALAWCLKNPNVSTVITGASKPEQVDENVKALEILEKIDDGVMKEIDEIFQNKPAEQELFGRWA
ncbi:Aldo/keto reductase [Saitoella complicata NRRL Y-17804]|uniref:Aldo/keto reductase n=1 Tax=Saitoella complicata (strain BCRC 22490 / CBS 7301 / JCM 7358 / NBRC 10748 / NRRL Y-17804) TaxID=698492 RepID=UPI000866B30A|nr:Aldo/keto reductase [Saitoella complicata NRRL Y-17804]ODQ54925.1 Aldo/keto reductase [Saitoella complicata NRRL Y-17804]